MYLDNIDKIDSYIMDSILQDIKEENYKRFSSSLIPGVKNMIGVRIPTLDKIAKEIYKKDYEYYLNNAKDDYFEEIMLQGLVIGKINDCDKSIKWIRTFIPKIDNWSVCDSFCTHLKIVKKNKKIFWEFIKEYYYSNKPYYIRFAVVIILLNYIDEEYIKEVFAIFDSIHNDNYYVKMAVAWAISSCFIRFPQLTREYLMNNKLDNDTFNKSINKICESLKVDKKEKLKIKSLKRK